MTDNNEKKKRLMIFIPSYKAEKTICWVLDRISDDLLERTTTIVVSDNHSPDNTEQILQEYKRKKIMSKLVIIRQSQNRYFGGNIKFGCDYAVKHGMDIMAVVHADGQYPVEHVPRLIQPIENGQAQAVSGSRFLGDPMKGGMPLWRYVGNIFLTKMEDVLINQKMSEWHSGFRAYDVNTLKKIPFKRCVNGYEWTTDILLMMCSNNSKIAEVEIPTHYGDESTSPSIKRTFLYFINSFRIALRYFLHRKGIRRLEKYEF